MDAWVNWLIKDVTRNYGNENVGNRTTFSVQAMDDMKLPLQLYVC